jgi:hypothetical protein
LYVQQAAITVGAEAVSWVCEHCLYVVLLGRLITLKIAPSFLKKLQVVQAP